MLTSGVPDTEGCTALHRAIDHAPGPYPELGQWLIEHGAATLIKDRARGFTALHFACRSLHIVCIICGNLLHVCPGKGTEVLSSGSSFHSQLILC